MPKKLWIGLFRGVNVGGNHKMPMKDLAAALSSAGFEEVRTYIQSGNVLFRSALAERSIAATIDATIEREFGFRAPLFLVDAAHLRALFDANPFKAREQGGKAQHFFFLDAKPKSVDLPALDSLRANGEEISVSDEVIYLYAPAGIGNSKLAAKIGRHVRADMTARNLNTVEKLLEMAAESA